MARREELKVDLTANDQASKVIDAVAAKAEGLSSAATVEITATDEASEKIDEVAEEVEGLDGEQAEVELAAEDEATEVVDEVAEAVETLDGETATAELDADDQASGDIEGVSGALSDLDGESASPTVDIEDEATSDIEDVSEALSTLDSESATPSVGVEGAEAAEEATGGIGGNLRAIGLPGGLAALSAAGMLAIGQKAADAVLEVQGLASATGGTLEQTSQLKEAWELAGGNVDTLERNIIRANDRLRESPSLAGQLGIAVTDNMTPMDLFIETVEALNSGQLTTNERLALAMDIFGSKGILMLNDLQARVGDLGDEMAATGENEIITQADVDAAIKLTQQWDAIEDSIGKISRTLLPGIAATLSSLEYWISGQAVNDIGDAINPFNDDDPWPEMTAAIAAQEQAVRDDVEEWTQLASVQSAAAGATDEAVEATDAAVEALEAHKTALEGDIELLDEQVDLLTEQADGFREAADAQLESEDANRGLTDATNAYAAAVAESGENSQEAADALREVRDAAIKVADAQVAVAQAQAQANGTTLSEVAALDIMNGSLLGQAATLNGPARQAILQRIADVNAIPSDVMTQIGAAIARGDLAEARRLLDAASAPRSVLMQARVDANAAAYARTQLALLTSPRSVLITPIYRTAGGAQYGFATGTTYAPRGRRVVGELGPEIVDFGGGEEVTNAGQTAEMMRNGSGGGGPQVVNNNTYHYPAGVRSWDTERANRRWQRLQAS